MSERSFPFDDSGGDRELDTAQWARHTAATASNGYVPGFEDELEVVATSPESLAVDVSLGRFWIEGRYYEVFSGAETVSLATADPTNPRIDRIVVRRSIANREVTVEALTGTPGVSPSAPALTQSAAGDWEESLAQVAVAANETEIATADITDERKQSRVLLLPSLGWVPIGFEELADLREFTIDLTAGGQFPAGTFSRIMINLRGNLTVENDLLGARVNDDTTAGLHQYGAITRDATDSNVAAGTAYSDAGTFWRIAYWGTRAGNTCRFELHRTHVSAGIGYDSTSVKNGALASTHNFTTAGGKLQASRLIDSIRITSGAELDDFENVEWWAMGYVDGIASSF